MEIGLISDVHGNLPALEAVLDDMPPVDEVVCAGDVVGYNAWPAACLERVREVATVTVQGNHDRNVETPERYGHHDLAGPGLEHAREQLTDEQRQWLADRPQRTTFGDGAYRLAHSHPDPDKLGTYVRPGQFSEMRSYLEGYAGLVLGHTHVQHDAALDEGLVVNPGSVGQPRDADPRAAYAVLDTAANAVSLHRVEYDIDRVISKTEAVGLPVRAATRLLEGK